MKFEITLRVTTPDGDAQEHEVIVLDKGHDRHEDIGLSIDEGIALLKALQEKIVEALIASHCGASASYRSLERSFLTATSWTWAAVSPAKRLGTGATRTAMPSPLA